MIADELIEQRLLALESRVANLQVRLSKMAPATSWIDEITGSISDDEAFQEALEFGRAFRHADRPKDEADE